MPVARRKERGFRLPDNFSISDYTDDELRSRYRFGRESTAFLVDLLRDDLESISNLFRLENPGVSSRISIIFSLTWKGCFGAGPSPGGGQLLPLFFNFLQSSLAFESSSTGCISAVFLPCNFPFFRGIFARSTIFFRACMRMTSLTGLM